MNLTAKSSLSDVLIAYCAKRQLTPGTRETYVNALRVLTEVTGLKRVEDLERKKPGAIQDAFDEALEAKGYRPKTLSMAFLLGKSLRRFLRLKDLVKENCFDAVRVKVGNNVPEHNVLKPGELEKLILALEGAARARADGSLIDAEALRQVGLTPVKSVQLLAVVLMLGRHGLRVHELCKLKVDDVQKDANGTYVATFRGKGDKLARMVITRDAMKACAAWRKKVSSPTSFLCPASSGAAMSRITLAHDLARLTERVLGHRVTPHGFRATFISGVIAKKGIEAARKLARHSSLNVTQRYSRWEILDAGEE